MHSAPVSGILSVIGFMVVIIAMAVSGWVRRERTAETDQRRAA